MAHEVQRQGGVDAVIVRDEARALAELGGLSEEQLAQFEKQVQTVNRVKRIALQVTSPHDWTRLGDTMHLNESGCSKIAQLFGVSFSRPVVEEHRATYGGRDTVTYTAMVDATWLGRVYGGDGAASSSDAFFGLKQGRELTLAEINLPSVRKKAVTNAQSRALKKMLALGGLTDEDIGASRVDQSAVSRVSYEGSKARKQDRTGAAGGDVRTQLRNILADLAIWDDTNESELVRQFSQFEDKEGNKRSKTRIQDLSDGWARSTLAKAKDRWDTHPARVGGREPGE